MTAATLDPKKCWRRKVIAEITLAHVEHIAQQLETAVPGDAARFLNEQGRAYELWKVMMRAAEEYIKTELREAGSPREYARAWAAAHSR